MLYGECTRICAFVLSLVVRFLHIDQVSSGSYVFASRSGSDNSLQMCACICLVVVRPDQLCLANIRSLPQNRYPI